jgi:transposase-like protein
MQLSRQDMNGEAVYGNYYALREADSDTPVGDVCRQLGVSETSFYLWRKRLREGRAHRDSGDAATAPGEHSSDAADCASHPAQTYIERSRNRALRALRRTLTCFGAAQWNSGLVLIDGPLADPRAIAEIRRLCLTLRVPCGG